MDSLFTVIVLALAAALANWLKKSGQQQDRGQDNPPTGQPGQQNRPPVKKSTWQDELQRMLDESPGYPSPPAAPPLFKRSAPPAVPQRPTVIAGRQMPTTVTKPPAVITQQPTPEFIEMPAMVSSGNLAQLDESRLAYERASQIGAAATAQVQRAAIEHVKPTVVFRRAAPIDVQRGLALFRSPESVRQAVIASVIFAPPRALDPVQTF